MAPEPRPHHAVRPRYLDRLIGHAAKEYRVTPALVMSKSRDARVVAARAATMWTLRDEGLSLPHIGHLMGRDHTTVLHATRKVDADPAQLIQAMAISMAVLHPETGP